MTQQEKTAFFNRYKYAAIWEHIYTGVPASITLAQAAIESNYGTSALFVNANNAFGIKAYSNPHNFPLYYATDDLINEPFRSYPNVRTSFKDHSDFLLENSRYNSLFLTSDSSAWADGLKVAGYATNPNYNTILKSIIKDNDLEKYDFYGDHKYFIIISAIVLLAFIAFLIYKFIINLNKKTK